MGRMFHKPLTGEHPLLWAYRRWGGTLIHVCQSKVCR